jgi:hypothetical protein
MRLKDRRGGDLRGGVMRFDFEGTWSETVWFFVLHECRHSGFAVFMFKRMLFCYFHFK